MSSDEVHTSMSFSTLLVTISKCLVESLVCLCIIVINIILIISLIRIQRPRTAQNLLLINVSVACILFSLSCLLSITFTISILSTKIISPFICQWIGVIVISTCHILMYSYALVAFVRFLTIIYPFNRKITTIRRIQAYLVFKWISVLILFGASFHLSNQLIIFQSKAKICAVDQRSPLLFMYFCTGYIIPVVFISLMNFITYVNVIRSRQMSSVPRSKLSRLNRRKLRNLRLLRQFSLFTIIFLFGWTPFMIIEIVDRYEKLSDVFYLTTLTLPSICVLIDSTAILYWNKTIYHRIQQWCQSVTNRRQTIHREHTHNPTYDQDITSVCTSVDV